MSPISLHWLIILHYAKSLEFLCGLPDMETVESNLSCGMNSTNLCCSLDAISPKCTHYKKWKGMHNCSLLKSSEAILT